MNAQILNEIRLRQLYSQIDKYEDSGLGCCIFALPKVQQILASSIKYISEKDAKVFAYVIMPNHVHLLLQPETKTLSEIVKSFKLVTGHAINRELQRKGNVWERDYFDRFIRDPEHFRKCARYVCKNSDTVSGKSRLWISGEINIGHIVVPECVRFHSGIRSTVADEWMDHGRLIHYDEIGICQFVTLRLFDSVPAEAIVKWKTELGIVRKKVSLR